MVQLWPPKKKKVMVQTTRQYSIEEPKKKGKKPKRMSSWQGLSYSKNKK